MATKYNIRWRDSDIKKLQNTIRNYNARLARLARSRPDLAPILPQRTNFTNVREIISSRNDFNRVIKSLNRATRKNLTTVRNVNNYNITNYEYREIQYANRRLNNANINFINTVKSYGGYSTSESEPQPIDNFRDIDLNVAKNIDELRKLSRIIQRRNRASWLYEQNQTYKDNYLSALEFIPEQYRDELIEIINSLTPEQVVAAQSYNDNLSLRDYYEEVRRGVNPESIYADLLPAWKDFAFDIGLIDEYNVEGTLPEVVE